MTSAITEQIEKIFAEKEDYAGTERLVKSTNCMNKTWVRHCLYKLERAGLITIIRGGGRGHKTIYRRNRNQPGLPRKVHKRTWASGSPPSCAVAGRSSSMPR